MKRENTKIPGCFVSTPFVSVDQRGTFVKVFRENGLGNQEFPQVFQEEFYTISGERILRGMHFQVPPYDHDKLVLCMQGQVFDVTIDLRRNSPTYGNHQIIEMDGSSPSLLYIPRGLAHGFYVMKAPAIMCYWVTCGYKAEADSGILWNSMNIDWPDSDPIISARDSALIPFENFSSPFTYQEGDDARRESI